MTLYLPTPSTLAARAPSVDRGAAPRRRRMAGCAVALVLAGTALPALAQQGLALPAADWLWPQVQVRLALQTATLSPLATTRLAGDGERARGVQGGALLGDVVFARPALGSFRATSGLLLGSTGGAPTGGMLLGSRLGLGLTEGAPGAAAAADTGARPYLGVGYDSAPGWGGLSVSADLGLAATGVGGVGRALAGQLGWDAAVRDLRLSPRLQVGLRLAF